MLFVRIAALPKSSIVLRIGLDFDNTLVNYGQVFWLLARERGLISADLPQDKQAVRDALRAQGLEAIWIELQGEVYGAQMHRACPFAGVTAFLKRATQAGHTLYIISHKTRTPFYGPPYDLQQAARRWIQQQAWPIPETQVFFEETQAAKLLRIEALALDCFVDDLPEFLSHPDFPVGVQRWLFDPQQRTPAGPWHLLTSWQDFSPWDHRP